MAPLSLRLSHHPSINSRHCSRRSWEGCGDPAGATPQVLARSLPLLLPGFIGPLYPPPPGEGMVPSVVPHVYRDGWCMCRTRRDSLMLRRCILTTVFLVLVCLPGWAADVDLLMGNPSKARTDPTQKHNYLMNKE